MPLSEDDKRHIREDEVKQAKVDIRDMVFWKLQGATL